MSAYAQQCSDPHQEALVCNRARHKIWRRFLKFTHDVHDESQESSLLFSLEPYHPSSAAPFENSAPSEKPQNNSAWRGYRGRGGHQNQFMHNFYIHTGQIFIFDFSLLREKFLIIIQVSEQLFARSIRAQRIFQAVLSEVVGKHDTTVTQDEGSDVILQEVLTASDLSLHFGWQFICKTREQMRRSFEEFQAGRFQIIF